MAAPYFDWRAQYGAQFSGSGTGWFAENPTATHRDADYSCKDQIILSSSGSPARLVDDAGIFGERVLALDASGDILAKFVRCVQPNSRLSGKDEAEVEETRDGIAKGLFNELPVLPPEQTDLIDILTAEMDVLMEDIVAG